MNQHEWKTAVVECAFDLHAKNGTTMPLPLTPHEEAWLSRMHGDGVSVEAAGTELFAAAFG